MERPWITAQDVIDYSDLSDVVKRNPSKLSVDIRRAESYIIKYCNNDFSEECYKDAIPEDVRVADILLAEYFAHNTSKIGSKKSETFDDYSYTMDDSSIEVTALGLDTLLAPYIKTKPSGNVNMRMRRL